MIDPALLRFLELVVRELGATDARVELGGRDPDGPGLVFAAGPNGARVVAVFEGEPQDRELARARLSALVESLLSGTDVLPEITTVKTPPDIARHRLNEELSRLADRASARRAAVVDLASPIVWGASRVSDPSDEPFLEAAIQGVREGHEELRLNHTSRLRVSESLECLARPFAGPYVLILAFDGVVSEPVAIGALVHAMPVIVRLVLALPPWTLPREGRKS